MASSRLDSLPTLSHGVPGGTVSPPHRGSGHLPPATLGVPEGDRTGGANQDLHRGVLAISGELREGGGRHTPREQLRVPPAIALARPLLHGQAASGGAGGAALTPGRPCPAGRTDGLFSA